MDRVAQTTAEVPVRQVIVNSRFRARRLWSWIGHAHNIALLQLQRPLTFSKYVWPICLPNLEHPVETHSLCTVTGWGLPGVNGESQPPRTGGWCATGPGHRLGSAGTGQSETSLPPAPCPALPSGSGAQRLLPLEGFSGGHAMVIQASGDGA